MKYQGAKGSDAAASAPSQNFSTGGGRLSANNANKSSKGDNHGKIRNARRRDGIGDNVCEVVAIEASSFNPEADTGAFVRVLAARCKTYDDSEIRTDTPENTVADLIKSGFLTPCNSLQE